MPLINGEEYTNIGTAENPIYKKSAGSIPAGGVSAFAGSSAPGGWLLCDGNEYSQSEYNTLFSVLGSTYNTGGETTGYFRVPDLRGRVIAGLDNMGGTAAGNLTNQTTLGGDTGTQSVKLTHEQSGLPSHRHGISYYNEDTAGGNQTDRVPFGGTLTGYTKYSGGTDASESHTNVQPTMTLNYIIKT